MLERAGDSVDQKINCSCFPVGRDPTQKKLVSLFSFSFFFVSHFSEGSSAENLGQVSGKL